jgi:hypothetical protein
MKIGHSNFFRVLILLLSIAFLAGKCSKSKPPAPTTNPSTPSSPPVEAVVQIPISSDEFYSSAVYANLPPQCKFDLNKPFTMITSVLTHDSNGDEVSVWGNVKTNADFYNATNPSVAMMVPLYGEFFIRSLIIFDGCTECCGFTLLNNANTPLDGCISGPQNNWAEQGKMTMELESQIYLNATGAAGQVFPLDFKEILCDCNCM